MKMPPPFIREPGDGTPKYGANYGYFTVELHHGGNFYVKPNNLTYEHGLVIFFDFFHASLFTKSNLMKFLNAVGHGVKFEFYYKKRRLSLGQGLRRLESENDIKEMLKDRDGHPVVQIYVVAPSQLQALPLHAFLSEVDTLANEWETVEDCYVPYVEENEDGEPVIDWSDDFFDMGGDMGVADVGDMGVEGVGDMGGEDDEVEVEAHNDEQSREDEVEGLVESDYDVEDQPAGNVEIENERVNFDFGFGVADEHRARGSDTDYGDSDELRSIDGTDEDDTTSRRKPSATAFNSSTDMEDPKFRRGLVFDSKALLKAAITSYSVRSNREIKFKKDDKWRLRAKCKGDCTWVLYATKEHNRTSWVIKTYVEEHTCPMVYKNFRVNSSYLADRYLSDWRSEPNMSVSTFMERVKRDGLGDISPWQVYRTKEKALEKIRGTVVDHYKVLWDYCEELKRTNIGTTAVVEGVAGEFRRLYICLGALKEGFTKGCRRVIGLDGCFLKTDQGGQLLSAVGVDANNGMYPVAYAVVEVENGENWRWFLELLKDDLHIHNAMYWTFISDKQKGLVNAIEAFFEGSEHRTCVRHLYNNFSMLHKGLALKHCLWDAARATTVPQWLEHMQKMLDLDPAAYGWLEPKPASHWSKSHFKEWTQCDMLLNNLCETFNSTIVSAREKPILTMLEEIRVYLMKRIIARREAADKWTSAIGPRIQKILDKHSTLSRFEWAEYAGNEKFQVRHNAGIVQQAVDLRDRTCTCRAWQLSGIPCCHVIASVVSRGLCVVDYVHAIYKKDSYLMTYTPSISPITGPNSWPSPGLNQLRPPVYTKKAGRPKKNRRKEPNEVESSSQAKRSRKSSQQEIPSETTSTGMSSAGKRAGQTQTCRKCGEPGHNRRSCKGAPPPPADN